jgi:hypothetical protein
MTIALFLTAYIFALVVLSKAIADLVLHPQPGRRAA